MNLPFRHRARFDRKKIVEYLLAPSHPDGGSKARFFSSFGFTVNRWETLAKALKGHGKTFPVVGAVESKYGTRYTVEGRISTPDNRDPGIRSVWMLSRKSKSPRLITAYPI